MTENFKVEINAPNYCLEGSESEYYSDKSNKYEDKWWMPSFLRDDFGSGLRTRKQKYYNEHAPSEKGQTPLHLAAKNGHLSMCRWIMENTGKSFSEALILVSTNPQYDKRLLIELRVQYMKIPSSEHVENMLLT